MAFSIGKRVTASTTVPLSIIESTTFPVENEYENPPRMFPSLLSAIELPKLREYVVLESSGSWNSTTIPFFFILAFTGFFCGGDKRMFLLASLIWTYSLNVIVISPFWRGKFTAPSGGYTSSTVGGIVSLGPPLGAALVLAQELVWRQYAATSRNTTALYM